MVRNAADFSTGDRPTKTSPSTTTTTISISASVRPVHSTATETNRFSSITSKKSNDRLHSAAFAFPLQNPTTSTKASTTVTATTIPAIITTTNLTSSTTTVTTSPPADESILPTVPTNGQLESSLPESEFVVPTLASTASGTINSDLSSTETTPSRRRIAPVTVASRRIAYPATRLSLQMPTRGASNLMLEPAVGYSSVARRPRLDFTRACTSLHHSTVAESSPESSPLASSSFHRRCLESPLGFHSSSGGGGGMGGYSSSTSISMLDSNANSSDSGDSSDDDMDFGLLLDPSRRQSVNMDGSQSSNPSFMDMQRARLRGGKTSSSSSSGANSAIASPARMNTPPLQTHSSGLNEMAGGNSRGILYNNMIQTATQNRANLGGGDSAGEEPMHFPRQDPVRRPVSRRGNLFPKSKSFQRIRAELQEEAHPVDMEVKREAEITRQIREEDGEHPPEPEYILHHPFPTHPQSITPTATSPTGLGIINDTTPTNPLKAPISFQKEARKNSAFSFEPMDISASASTPPQMQNSPPSYPTPRGSRVPNNNNADGDVMMLSDFYNTPISTPLSMSPDLSRRTLPPSATSGFALPPPPPQLQQPMNLKRRRGDDTRFEDPYAFKRRAVSPSLMGSPILAASPGTKRGGANAMGLENCGDGLTKMSLQ